MSLKVINPRNLYSSSTIRSFSILFNCKIDSASFNEVPTGAVIKFFSVITSTIALSLLCSKRKSLLVTIPLNLPRLSITGIPPILCSLMALLASATTAVSGSVTGSMIIPLSALFTFLTS